MKFYKDYIPLKYLLSVENKIYDVRYLGFDYLDNLPYPLYFIFDCRYEYYHYKLKYCCNDEIVEKCLNIFIKINLYRDCNNYYIKFNDLFSCFNDKLLNLMSIYDYKELKLYDLHRDIEDLAKYFEINFGIEVRKD